MTTTEDQIDAIIQRSTELLGGIAIMADELQAAQDALAKVTADVTNIQTAAQAAKDTNAQLQQQVADLLAQIAAGGTTGVDPAAVQAIADGLNAIDAQLDAVAPDPNAAPPQ